MIRHAILHAVPRVLILTLTASLSVHVFAQEATPEPESGDLVTRDVAVVAERDAFGQVVLMAEGELVNQGDAAYSDINLNAEIYDASNTLIGEGFGFLVNACGTGLLPDFALQPDQSQTFSVTLELYEEGTDIDHVDVLPEADAIEPVIDDNAPQSLVGITQISDQEVVDVEWNDDGSLIFGIGCDADVFTSLSWYQHPANADPFPIEHPDAARVTDALLTQLGLTDPLLYDHSLLTFSPTSRRIVYQTDINEIITAEPDGSFKRLIWDDLGRHSLHGFIWLPDGRFLAYYYGAYGEEVRYFTASVEGQRISASIYEVTPSITIPGPTPDGGRVVISTTVDDVTGYYLKDAFYPATELLFEGQPAGNNWPAPIYRVDDAAGQAFIYLVRPVDNQPLLQCFDMQTRQLNDLSVLPLQLATDDRAWTWLSPDGGTIVLAANGLSGGLWLIDLASFGGCGAPLAG